MVLCTGSGSSLFRPCFLVISRSGEFLVVTKTLGLYGSWSWDSVEAAVIWSNAIFQYFNISSAALQFWIIQLEPHCVIKLGGEKQNAILAGGSYLIIRAQTSYCSENCLSKKISRQFCFYHAYFSTKCSVL
ncbi:hypothetical protein NE237_016884 [Protea cynaroides]|uniref:Uncharacterized protein n=1 Tax=Protea cynaroides TaxID=273540 RepID=A0A9Q0HI02_9MAGN|nr:hypothetical protein NE237_016884 [Protea cynaroides]